MKMLKENCLKCYGRQLMANISYIKLMYKELSKVEE